MCHDCFPERCMVCYLRRFIFVTKGVVYVNFSNQSFCQYSNPAPIFTNKLKFNTGFLSEKVHPLSFLGLTGAKATILYPVKSRSQLKLFLFVNLIFSLWNHVFVVLVKTLLGKIKD